MNKKWFWLFGIILAFLLIITIIAGFKAHQRRIELLYHVAHQRIKEAALECYLMGDCEGTITLRELYEKEYLTVMVDPVTKEEMDEDMCLNYVAGTITFC
jgi:hypothetical protein